MIFSFYFPESGRFHGRTYGGPRGTVEANTPAGTVAIEGRYDRLSQRIDVAALAKAVPGDYSTTPDFVTDYQPSQPSPDHEWRENVANGRPRWIKKAEAVAREAKDRAARDALAEIDRRSVRAVRELLAATVPQIAAIEAEAAELRKDVIKTADEKVRTAERP